MGLDLEREGERGRERFVILCEPKQVELTA